MARPEKYVIGVDEAGRGSLAGPITAGAVAVPLYFRFCSDAPGMLRDPKRMTPGRRAEWMKYIVMHPRLLYTASSVSPGVIDREHITGAANTAAARAVSRLLQKVLNAECLVKYILTDGLLRPNLSNARYQIKCREIVKGDEKVRAIQLAAVVAKVTRDRKMIRLARLYPEYGFERHKGYGTRMHKEMLGKCGVSDIHRLTFLYGIDY